MGQEMVNVQIGNDSRQYPKGTPYLEIAKEYQKDYTGFGRRTAAGAGEDAERGLYPLLPYDQRPYRPCNLHTQHEASAGQGDL